MSFQIIKANTKEEYEVGAKLFQAYANSLDFTLSFQNFESELDIIPVMYGKPKGALLLVFFNGEYIGVAGLRQIENETTCEIKRMYVHPDYQNMGIGRALMQELINTAVDLKYKTIKLDTLAPKMPTAVHLYKSFGFRETLPYNFNPHEGIMYLEKNI